MSGLTSRLAWIAVVSPLVCTSAAAQTPTDAELDTARNTARQGITALEHGDYLSAEDLLSRALAIHDAPTLRLARARARKALGRMLAAAEDYRVTVRWPVQHDEPRVFATARKEAGAELTTLEPRIPRLTVNLQGRGKVKVGGVEWPEAAMGAPRLLDPGDYVIEAVGADGGVSTTRIRLEPGQSETAKLDLVHAAKQAPARVAATSAAATTPARAAATVAPTQTGASSVDASAQTAPLDKPSTDHTAAYIVGGASVALLVASLVTGGQALKLRSKFNEQNRADVEQSDKTKLRSDAVTMTWISTALTGAAVVGGGISAYLFLATPVETEANPRITGSGARWLGLQASMSGRF